MAEKKSSTFPLIFLILFVTISAILIRIMTPVIHMMLGGSVDTVINPINANWTMMIPVLIFSPVCGLFIGAFHYNRSLGCSLGFVCGIAVCVIAVPLLYTSLLLSNLMLFLFLGMGLLIVYTGTLMMPDDKSLLSEIDKDTAAIQESEIKQTTNTQPEIDPTDFANF